jgi:hypothetical protein
MVVVGVFGVIAFGKLRRTVGRTSGHDVTAAVSFDSSQAGETIRAKLTQRGEAPMKKSNMRRIVTAVCVLSAVVLGAQTAKADVTVTFDSLPTGTFSTLTQVGYTLTSSPGYSLPEIVNIGGNNGNVLEDNNTHDVYGALTTFTQTGGGTFNLYSLDLAALDSPANGSGPYSVATGGGFRVEVDGSNGNQVAYATNSSTFSTISLSGFTGLTSFSINVVSYSPNSQTFAVDNVVLSNAVAAAVPEPSTLAIALVGGLGMVAYGYRRQRARR